MVLLFFLVLTGCGPRNWKGSVPVESRPTPPQPGEASSTPAPTEDDSAARVERVVADTTWTGEKVRRCLGQRLLPDQEATIEVTLDLLRQARSALIENDAERAESAARRARQLAESLRCT